MSNSSTDRVEKKIELNASPDRVWQALTDYKQFGQWFKANLETAFIPGKITRGKITEPRYEHIPLEMAVQNMEAQRRFSYRWHPYAVDPTKDYSQEPPTLVEFTLQKTTKGTLLVVTEMGFDAIPAQRREEARRMHDGGWAGQMKNIEKYLGEGNKTGT